MPPKKARLSAEAAVNNILRFVENDEDKCVKTLCQDTPTPFPTLPPPHPLCQSTISVLW